MLLFTALKSSGSLLIRNPTHRSILSPYLYTHQKGFRHASRHAKRHFRLGMGRQPRSKETIKEVEARTLKWVHEVVIGLHLCPFAEHPLRTDKLRIVAYDLTNHQEVFDTVADEMMISVNTGTTALIVCPNFFPDDFESYWNLVNELEEGNPWSDALQIAPFHPQFRFDGNDESSPDNYTNRSPYPTFHLLLEKDVTKAVERMNGDSSVVWSRNVDLMNRLHQTLPKEEFKTVFLPSENGDENQGLRDKVHAVLKDFPNPLKNINKDKLDESSPHTSVADTTSSSANKPSQPKDENET